MNSISDLSPQSEAGVVSTFANGICFHFIAMGGLSLVNLDVVDRGVLAFRQIGGGGVFASSRLRAAKCPLLSR